MPEEIGNQAPLETVPKKKSKWVIVLIIIVLLLAGAVFAFGAINKKAPAVSDEVSTSETPSATTVSDESDEPIYDKQQYSWSTKTEGPYNDKVSYATSTDLLTWKDSGVTLAEHASVPDVVYKDGVLYSYFVDVSTDGYAEKVGLIKSTDNGKTWTGREFVKIKGLGQKAAVDPAPYLLEDGRIRLFYLDLAEMRKPESKGKMIKNKIYSAISSDGINFVEEDGVRLEYEGVFDPCVIKVSGNLWRMYVGNQDGQKVLTATSTDGLSFTYEGVAHSGSAIPNVIFENNTYYLFTGGIEIATSKDGKTFTKTTNRFSLRDKVTADPGVVKLGENNFLMVYKTKEMKTATPQPRQNP